MSSLRVTLDTNLLNRETYPQINQAASGLPIELANTTVSNREQGLREDSVSTVIETGVWDESQFGRARFAGPIPETLVIEESSIGTSVIGDTSDLFEYLLVEMWSGSFPKQGGRENLTDVQRKQLRDVMILVAHVRDGRDILISDDKKAFGADNSAKRSKLESACNTRILSSAQFIKFCDQMRKDSSR